MTMPENWISVDSGSVPPPPIYPPFGWSHFDIPKDITTVEEAVQYALKKRQLEPTYFDSQVRLWGYQCVDDDGKVKPKVKTKIACFCGKTIETDPKTVGRHNETNQHRTKMATLLGLHEDTFVKLNALYRCTCGHQTINTRALKTHRLKCTSNKENRSKQPLASSSRNTLPLHAEDVKSQKKLKDNGLTTSATSSEAVVPPQPIGRSLSTHQSTPISSTSRVAPFFAAPTLLNSPTLPPVTDTPPSTPELSPSLTSRSPSPLDLESSSLEGSPLHGSLEIDTVEPMTRPSNMRKRKRQPEDDGDVEAGASRRSRPPYSPEDTVINNPPSRPPTVNEGLESFLDTLTHEIDWSTLEGDSLLHVVFTWFAVRETLGKKPLEGTPSDDELMSEYMTFPPDSVC